MTNSVIAAATGAFAKGCRDIYGQKLNSVILFGSCARGDYEQDSDIDIMVLLDAPHGDAAKVQWRLIEISNKIGLEYDVVISPVVQSYETFNEYLPASGFFQSVLKEGVKIA